MLLAYPNRPLLVQEPKGCHSNFRRVTTGPASPLIVRVNNIAACAHGPKEGVRKMFLKTDLSMSPYDTAWVAMVPSPKAPQFPCFPECLNWLLENQLPDGSWGLPDCHPLLLKDAVSSTLACVLALKRWNVGGEHVKRGLLFIGSNFDSVNDLMQYSPIGFDIIFPGMIEYAQDLGLDLPLSRTAIGSMLLKRDLELKRGNGANTEGQKAYLAYAAEGLGKSQDWKDIMKYQRKNGSLFNSPSTTAAALMHLWDDKCLEYLRSLLEIFGNAVPTAYPLDIYTQLLMVDNLERLGIARHFCTEIKGVLDETYRCWLQSDEEIFLDCKTCAMAFRLLRMNGYDISSDALLQFAEEDSFSDLVGGHMKSIDTVLELYRASQIMTFSNELVFEKLNSWTSHFLRRESMCAMHRIQEVDYELKCPHYANLERLYNRRNIEHYNAYDFNIMKTSYRSGNIHNKDILELAVEDFKICQSIQRKELELLEMWVKENRLDQLKFARQNLNYCYFSVAATLFSPEQSDARMSWAKSGVLITVVDDFFDVGGSRRELINLIELIEQLDGNSAADCCSEQVEIIFAALHSTINEIGEKAFSYQGRNIIRHVTEIWVALLKSMMREADWLLQKSVPTLDEYMKNGYVSVALGPIVLPTLYFVGPKLSEEEIKDPDYQNLFELTSTCGRLLNDMEDLKRDEAEGKLNGVSLRVIHGRGHVTEEEALREMRGILDISRREVLRSVLKTKGSVIPRECKDVFWKMCRILHCYGCRNDGFISPQEMVKAVNAVIYDPLNLPSRLTPNVTSDGSG